MIETIQRFASAFVSGELNPFWTRLVLLGGAVAAEFAIATGIILEAPKEKSRREWLGLVLVFGGVVVGAVFTISLFFFDEAIEGKVYQVAQAASHTAAAQGVQVVQQQEQMKEVLDRLVRLEERESRFEAGAVSPPPSSVANPPPSTSAPRVIPPGGARHIGPEEARIIRSTTLPGATVSIIPFMAGEPESFADALAAALSAVPGAQVAVGRGNFIINGQTGLIVQYDHDNPVSASVLEALRHAGLNPIDGPAVPGPVVFIKVAPQ